MYLTRFSVGLTLDLASVAVPREGAEPFRDPHSKQEAGVQQPPLNPNPGLRTTGIEDNALKPDLPGDLGFRVEG